MKLNPEKCAFGVESGKFLDFLITRIGIDANQEKVDALIRADPPTTVKVVQKLKGVWPR